MRKLLRNRLRRRPGTLPSDLWPLGSARTLGHGHGLPLRGPCRRHAYSVLSLRPRPFGLLGGVPGVV